MWEQVGREGQVMGKSRKGLLQEEVSGSEITEKVCVQFIEWQLEPGSKSESIHVDPNVKMANFKAEINMFTALYKKWFWSL